MKNQITVFGRRGMLFLCVIALAGCPTDGGGTNPGTDPGDGFTTPAKYREMVSLTGGVIPGSSDSSLDESGVVHSVFVSGRSVTLSPFKIAKYETTYQLWKEVYDWAAAHGYSFAHEGKEGYPFTGNSEAGKGTDSALWTAAEKRSRPATWCITWRDAIVWCNAYSEMSGKAPVYSGST
jgi:formylglycine-generating enzyme required for sulfatase activity